MKRAGILLLTFVLAGVLSAPAQATPPAHAKAVGQSPEDVVAYWTAKRMRDAKPIDRARGGGKGAKTTYPFSRY